MTTQTKTDAIANIVSEMLVQRFGDEFAFDPIIVEPEIDRDGEEYLHITIVFDGDQKHLDPEWTAGLLGRIFPKLIELGIDEFPSKSFVEKSEWEEIQKGRYFEPA